MDEMKINLSTKLMRGLISKIIVKSVKKSLGIDVEIELNKLEVTMANGKIFVNADVSGSTDSGPLIEMVKDKLI